MILAQKIIPPPPPHFWIRPCIPGRRSHVYGTNTNYAGIKDQRMPMFNRTALHFDTCIRKLFAGHLKRLICTNIHPSVIQYWSATGKGRELEEGMPFPSFELWSQQPIECAFNSLSYAHSSHHSVFLLPRITTLPPISQTFFPLSSIYSFWPMMYICIGVHPFINILSWK